MSVVHEKLVVRGGAGESVGAVDTDDGFAWRWRRQYGRSFGILCEAHGPCGEKRDCTESKQRLASDLRDSLKQRAVTLLLALRMGRSYSWLGNTASTITELR